jgi:hypothetical protein
MARASAKTREKARQLFLTGAMESNVEIARHLGLKPHTIGQWRREEDWDSLRLEIDRRAAQKMVETIATDRVALNVRHYRYWEAMLVQIAETLKAKGPHDVRTLERMAGILDRAQKGQRLAKGLSVDGETEEAVRAQAQAEIRGLIDSFVSAVKENIADESVREQISLAVLSRLPREPDGGADERGQTGQ